MIVSYQSRFQLQEASPPEGLTPVHGPWGNQNNSFLNLSPKVGIISPLVPFFCTLRIISSQIIMCSVANHCHCLSGPPILSHCPCPGPYRFGPVLVLADIVLEKFLVEDVSTFFLTAGRLCLLLLTEPMWSIKCWKLTFLKCNSRIWWTLTCLGFDW